MWQATALVITDRRDRQNGSQTQRSRLPDTEREREEERESGRQRGRLFGNTFFPLPHPFVVKSGFVWQVSVLQGSRALTDTHTVTSQRADQPHMSLLHFLQGNGV